MAQNQCKRAFFGFSGTLEAEIWPFLAHFWTFSKNLSLTLPACGGRYQDDLIYIKRPFLAKFFADFEIFRLSLAAAEIEPKTCYTHPINKIFFPSKISQKNFGSKKFGKFLAHIPFFRLGVSTGGEISRSKVGVFEKSTFYYIALVPLQIWT